MIRKVLFILIAGLLTGVAGLFAADEAVAVLHPASGSSCKGIVRMTQEGSALKVVGDIEGLPPNTKHGFHVHEFGDCTAPDAASAGGHYDPEGTKHHGTPTDEKRHIGDMGNVESDAAGKVHYEVKLEGATISGSQAPVLGRAIIVHAKPDDFSQPVGNAGGRIACGVLGIAKPK